MVIIVALFIWLYKKIFENCKSPDAGLHWEGIVKSGLILYKNHWWLNGGQINCKVKIWYQVRYIERCQNFKLDQRLIIYWNWYTYQAQTL